ncbi:NACHT domain-containing protein [Kribbella sp. NPDC049174]|uniref:NACHT domain-containing protein n=1 Tax=Kribbella sp. NPDC049174 TaxID=3364112 RepID=UPI00371647D0
MALFLGTAGLVLWRSSTAVLTEWLALTGVSVAALVGWVIKGIRQWHSGSDAAETRQLAVAAADLAMTVRVTWSREAVHRGLISPLPVAVRIRSADARIAAHPAQWLGADLAGPEATLPPAQLGGTAADIADVYARVSTGRLVIIGAPGGGKTGAALLLLLALSDLPRAVSRIPVWFALGSWDPVAKTGEGWMADQLVTTYGTPRAVARDLVGTGYILPILDGLDEIPDVHRSAAMVRLRTLDGGPMVLTCRTKEYTQAVAARVLDGAAVVEVVPVDPATAVAYLTRSGSADTARWDDVARALNADPPSPCREALNTPLMLSLARIVYQARDSDPSELTAHATAVQVENQLLDGLVPAVYGRDPADTTAEDARRWLSYLAENLHVLGPVGIAWWRLPLCLPSGLRRMTAGLAWGVSAFICALSSALILAIYWTRMQSFVVSLGVGLTAALVGAAVASAPTTPSQWRKPGIRDIARGLKAGLAAGLTVGAAGGLVVGLATGFLDGLRDGFRAGFTDATDVMLGAAAAIGILAALAFGFTVAFSRQQRNAVSPVSAFRADVKASLMAWLATTLAIAVPIFLLQPAYLIPESEYVAQPPESEDVPLQGPPHYWFWVSLGALVLGFLGGLVSFLWFLVQRSAVVRYRMAVEIIAWRSQLPRRPLRFLEDAYRRGVVRQAGMVYEFRHARLADRLCQPSS